MKLENRNGVLGLETAKAVISFVLILIVSVLCVAFIAFLTLYLPNLLVR